MKKNLFFVLLSFLSFTSLAQVVVSGKVVDADIQQPLPGANVIVKGKVDKGTVSDVNGKFSIRMDANAEALEVSFVGYEPVKIKLGATTQNLVISLIPSSEDLNEIQVVGFQTERSLQETSASISLLTAKDLQKTNSTSLAQSLNNLPGIRIDQSGLENQRITIRGIGANSNLGVRGIKVYFNDIPLTEPDGYTRLEALDFTTVGRVEIIRGPASSLYGTANGGVMNFTSERPAYGTTSISYNNVFGVGKLGNTFVENNLMRNGFVFKHGSAKANIYASWSGQSFDGYRVNNTSNRDNINFMGQFFLSSKLSLNAVYARLRDDNRYPLALTGLQVVANPQVDAFINNYTSPTRVVTPRNSVFYKNGRDQTWTRYGVNLKYDVSDAFKLSGSYFWGTNDQVSIGLTGPATSFVSLGKSNGYRINGSFKPKMEKLKTAFNFGVEYQNFSQTGSNGPLSALDGQSLKSKINSASDSIAASVVNRGHNLLYFVQAEVELTPKTILTLGVGYNTYQYEREDVLKKSDNIRFKDFDPITAPRIALNHVFGDGLAFRASLSGGFTAPILNEALVSATSGEFNPVLEGSKSQQLEFGIRGAVTKDKRVQYDVAWYNMTISNELVTETRNFVPLARNAAKTSRTGLEATLSFDAIRPEDKQDITMLRIRGAYTLQDFKYDDYIKTTSFNGNAAFGFRPTLATGAANPDYVAAYDKKEDFSGKTIPGYAPNLFNLGIDIETKAGLYFTMNYNYVAETQLFDGNGSLQRFDSFTGLSFSQFAPTLPKTPLPVVNETVRPAYAIINFNAGWNKTFGHYGVKIYTTLDNLSNTSYSGFVRVNDDQGRYFNPSLPRNMSIGSALTYTF
jgi:iron complex outermembrane recepter protein